MQYTTLGRTGLRVSVMGLGCGGHSRLGQTAGRDKAHSIRLVREALDLGVNFIDTAEWYQTEGIVGEALAGVAPERVVISTKKEVRLEDGSRYYTPDELIETVERSLRLLGRDCIDLYNVHSPRPEEYEFALEVYYPILARLRDEGKLRFIGITEFFNYDPTHELLARAVADGVWDVVMVGFNFLNQTARERVIAPAREKNIGVLDMFAVRRALGRPERLREVLEGLAREGKIDPARLPELRNGAEPLEFLLREGGAESLADAAYRFCRHEPGVHVVLSGTGDAEHLRANARSITAPPLEAGVVARLREMFAGVDNVTGE